MDKIELPTIYVQQATHVEYTTRRLLVLTWFSDTRQFRAYHTTAFHHELSYFPSQPINVQVHKFRRWLMGPACMHERHLTPARYASFEQYPTLPPGLLFLRFPCTKLLSILSLIQLNEESIITVSLPLFTLLSSFVKWQIGFENLQLLPQKAPSLPIASQGIFQA